MKIGFGIFDGAYNLEYYFNETLFDNIREAHETNCKMFLPFFANSWGIKNWLDSL